MDKKAKRELLHNREKDAGVLPSTAASSQHSVAQESTASRAHRKTSEADAESVQSMRRGEERVRALPTINKLTGHSHSDAPSHQASSQQVSYGSQQSKAYQSANTSGLPDLASNAAVRGMGKVSTNVAPSFKAAASKKHHTHPSKIKSTKMVPGGQKYAASQTQGAASMGVGGAGLASSPLCLLSLPCLVSLPSPALLFANLRATPPLPVTVAGRPCS